MWLTKAAHSLDRIGRLIAGISAAMAIACLLIMMLYVVADVFMRFVFNAPFKGSFEGVMVLMCFAFTFGLAWTQREKGHVAVTLLVSRLGERVQLFVERMIYAVYFITVLIIIWRATIRAHEAALANFLSRGEIAPFGKIPFSPFYYAAAMAFIPLAFVVLADLFNSLAKGMKT